MSFEVNAFVNNGGHKMIRVTEIGNGLPTVWSWNLTSEPDAFMHVSTDVVRAICQHVFILVEELAKQQRRAESAHLEEAKVVTSFGTRITELERQVTGVRALHESVALDGVLFCTECSALTNPDPDLHVPWPCPTIKALASDPAGKKPEPIRYD